MVDLAALIFFISLFIALAIGLTWLYFFQHRDETDVYKKASNIIIEKLSYREEMSIHSMIMELNLSPIDREVAHDILKAVAYILGIMPGQLRWHDKFEDILSIKKEEVGEYYYEKWEKSKLPECLTIAECRDLLDYFLLNHHLDEWFKDNNELTKRTRNKDELIFLMNKLTLKQLVKAALNNRR